MGPSRLDPFHDPRKSLPIQTKVLAVFPRDRPEARAMLGRWLVAYTFACKWALREEGRQRADLEGWLEPRELDGLVRSSGPRLQGRRARAG